MRKQAGWSGEYERKLFRKVLLRRGMELED